MIADFIQLAKKIRLYLLKRTVWRRYKIGPHFHAGARVRLWAKQRLEIGSHFYIGRDSQIEADCIIGDYVIFGNKVAIVGKYDHHFQQVGTPIRISSQIRDETYNWKGLQEITIIENDVWVGYGSIIMCGLIIGQGSIIAAGSVVTKNVEPYSIYGGNPARKIKNRFETKEEQDQHHQLVNRFYP